MARETRDSSLVGKEPCPSCGSSDNLARYSDGHAHCFTPGCKHWEPASDQPSTTGRNNRRVKVADLILDGEVSSLPKRHISEETCQKWCYTKATFTVPPVPSVP